MNEQATAIDLRLTPKYQRALDGAVSLLKSGLGRNLHSLLLYGSGARGGIVPPTSDLNLLVVLEASTADAHDVISRITRKSVSIDPMVIERSAMARATRVFALKFLSIKRDHVVLHGTNPLVDLDVAPDVMVLLSEQELRNMRMRLVHTYVMAGHRGDLYLKYLARNTARFFITFSDIVRCAGTELPHDLADRLPILAETIGTDVSVLDDLLKLERR